MKLEETVVNKEVSSKFTEAYPKRRLLSSTTTEPNACLYYNYDDRILNTISRREHIWPDQPFQQGHSAQNIGCNDLLLNSRTTTNGMH